jgi:hypothetical protein
MIGKIALSAVIFLLGTFAGINFVPVYQKSVQVRTTAEPVIDSIIEHAIQGVQRILNPASVSGESSSGSTGIISNMLGTKYSGTQLQNYALQLINQDRVQAGLVPVQLSSNQAAQAQAKDVLNTRQISHWMTDGEKPYMTYTRYALSVDPVISKGDFGTYTHVIIKNTGRQPVTNVKVDYGSQAKPDLIPVINPGERIMLSPPDGSDLSQVRVTADGGIDIVEQYRSPTNAPMIGNGGFGQ